MNQALSPMHTTAWLEAAAFGFALCDAQMRVRQANGRFRELLARDFKPASHLFDLLELPQGQRRQISESMQQKLQWQGLLRCCGRAMKVEIRAVADSTDRAVSIIDYSAELQHLQKLMDARNMAEKANEAKSRFLSHMSHELRTPLNAIIGFTQLLKLSARLDVQERDNVVEIEKAGGSLLGLINEILDLSRNQSGKLKFSEEHVDLAAVARECVQLVAPIAAQRKVSINLNIASDSLLLADYVRVKQILLNLLSNAIKYNHEGGEVSLHGLRAPDNKLRFEIRDSGAGIAPEHVQTIFSPFDRLGAGSIEGSGIGLLITRRLVALMQGEIGVFSVPERGSVFWVELPRKPLSVLESMLQDIETTASGLHDAAARGQIAWVGEDNALCVVLERLSELRPALHLRRYASAAELFADHAARQCVVFIGQSIASEELAEALRKHLKGAKVHVVMDHCERQNSSAAKSGQTIVRGDCKLTALLALLDDINRATEP